jgi:peptide chain release factor subunit 1
MSEDSKSEKKYTIDFEPFRPINTFLYLCDNKFHTGPLKSLLENDDTFGFIIVDGSGVLYGTLMGNTREILQKISVQLPKKHGRGGQSALRFARLRDEKRHNYLRKVAELATHHFISNDKCNVTGIVLAGSANFKNELSESDLFDQRLYPKVIKIVDVSYGMENGFNQAITLAQDSLANVKFVKEKQIISKFFEEIALDTGMIVFGIADTLAALDLSAIETIVMYENLEHNRISLRNPQTNELKTLILSKN